ncbi:O-antigen ligase family protein [Pseudomonas sp. R3-56]|uniref:O-antigen ligase family protein n=1 Tax=Pseudomonas sp. R3-56 TaxID=2817401 RepID=UPI003DA9B0EE
MPSNKLYHQLLIFLLWLPALLGLLHRDFRSMLKQPECALFAMLVVWTLVVLMVEGGDNALGKSKVVLYVTLTLAGVLLAAQNRHWRLESMVLGASILGGLFAAASWVYFYGLSARPLSDRLIAIGLWNTPIMAAHAVGSLAIMGVFTWRSTHLKPALMALLMIAALGYLLFLGSNQTRGVWIGLGACLLVMAMARPSRLGGALVALVVAGVALVAAFEPEILLQRGLSYRPQLWRGGIQLMLDHGTMGVGFHSYLIPVPEIGQAFKHPHNLFLDTGVRLGVPGLLLFGGLWLVAGWRGWMCRAQPLGQVLLALWVFASVSLMTDGIGLWLKPNADWLVIWLPIALSIVLAARGRAAGTSS